MMTGRVSTGATPSEVLDQAPAAMNALRAQVRAAKAKIKADARAVAKASAVAQAAAKAESG